jgi:hypothetical protein
LQIEVVTHCIETPTESCTIGPETMDRSRFLKAKAAFNDHGVVRVWAVAPDVAQLGQPRDNKVNRPGSRDCSGYWVAASKAAGC